jgi:hypothetical protein
MVNRAISLPKNDLCNEIMAWAGTRDETMDDGAKETRRVGTKRARGWSELRAASGWARLIAGYITSCQVQDPTLHSTIASIHPTVEFAPAANRLHA